MSTTIILDCDPGIDDALAISFAAGSPEIELAGITTVAGNVPLAKTTANALAVTSFVGAARVPVTAGCAAPLLRPAQDAGHVHGESGLGGAVLPRPARGAAAGHAIDFIIERTAAAFAVVLASSTLPATVVMPANSSSGCPAANAIASASSMPGSQSRMIVVLMRTNVPNGRRRLSVGSLIP